MKEVTRFTVSLIDTRSNYPDVIITHDYNGVADILEHYITTPVFACAVYDVDCVAMADYIADGLRNFMAADCNFVRLPSGRLHGDVKELRGFDGDVLRYRMECEAPGLRRQFRILRGDYKR